MPKISVLMPIYKTNPEHLKKAIASVINQTFTDFEFLILDDCPVDQESERIVKSYQDKRISYRHNTKNMGIANTHTALMQWAQSPYWAMMDHDDVMDKKRLEKQIAFMESHPNIGICGTAYRRFGTWKKCGVIYPSEHSDDIKAELFFKCPMLHPSIMIRADVAKKHHIFYNANYISANDRRLYLDMMPYTDFHNLPEVLMNYRMHANMTSKTKRDAITAEQKRLRAEILANMRAELSTEEEQILNDFVLKGRCRIKDEGVLEQVANVLKKIDTANQKSGYFPRKSFAELCAKYLIKRCLNAAIYGRISSRTLLQQTTLPVDRAKKPLLLKMLKVMLPTPKGRN